MHGDNNVYIVKIILVTLLRIAIHSSTNTSTHRLQQVESTQLWIEVYVVICMYLF